MALENLHIARTLLAGEISVKIFNHEQGGTPTTNPSAG